MDKEKNDMHIPLKCLLVKMISLRKGNTDTDTM